MRINFMDRQPLFSSGSIWALLPLLHANFNCQSPTCAKKKGILPIAAITCTSSQKHKGTDQRSKEQEKKKEEETLGRNEGGLRVKSQTNLNAKV